MAERLNLFVPQNMCYDWGARELVYTGQGNDDAVGASRCHSTGQSYGVDSLAAVEIRNVKGAKSDVSVFNIIGNDPLTALAAKIAGAR